MPPKQVLYIPDILVYQKLQNYLINKPDKILLKRGVKGRYFKGVDGGGENCDRSLANSQGVPGVPAGVVCVLI